jgi:transposase-like protein
MKQKEINAPISDLEGSERNEETSPLAIVREGRSRVPDPEVPEKARRRRFSAQYKLRILKKTDACEAGEVGALLRREGLYWSNLQTWRQQRENGTLKGLAPKKRGPKRPPANPLTTEMKKLERENRQLKRKLQRAEIMLDIQKKASELLGIPLATLEEEEDD